MGSNTPKAPKPWDRKPWPGKGDDDVNATYAGVGWALSQWEWYENVLSMLFGVFVSEGDPNKINDNVVARRAFVAVRTFEGRAEMLKAASLAHFERHRADDLQERFKAILGGSLSYSQRRNDIAHAVVADFFREEDFRRGSLGPGYALYPSMASFKDRAIDSKPSYCMTSIELQAFGTEFNALIGPAVLLIGALTKRAKPPPRPLRYRVPEPDPPSTNQDSGQTSPPEDEPQPKS